MKSLHPETYSEPAGIRIDVPGDLQDGWLIRELERRGYEQPRKKSERDWETPGAASTRLGFHKNWLCVLMRKGTHPPIEKNPGPDGRTLEVRLSPEFTKWAEMNRKRKS